MSSPRRTLSIPALTSLRFFAAGLVLAQHFWQVRFGHAGVGFFFVLSGYVLALNYAGKVDSTEERKIFWFKRFARIYPTYIVTLLFALPLAPTPYALPSFAMLQSWFPSNNIYFAANGPGWSLSNEAFFYALFPFILGVRPRTILLLGFAIILLACAWPRDWAIDTAFRFGPISVLPTQFLFYIFPPVRLLEFLCGIALARVPRSFGLNAEIGALLIAAFSLAAFERVPAPFGAALLFLPASVVLVHVFASSTGPIARTLAHPAFVMLGDASFMLYMIHWPIGEYLGHSIPTALLAIGLSVLLFVVFERPVQKKLLSWFRQRAERRLAENLACRS